MRCSKQSCRERTGKGFESAPDLEEREQEDCPVELVAGTDCGERLALLGSSMSGLGLFESSIFCSSTGHC